MKGCDSEKKLIKQNLAQAVVNCKKLKFTNCTIETGFKIVFKNFLDFKDEKYIDGEHSYKVDVSIEITYPNGDKIEKPSSACFTAIINGTVVTIANETLIIDQNTGVRL